MDRFDQMKVFCRVAERGSFSAVAKEMLTSQPSISRSIKQLEDKLGVLLFQRNTRILNLTEIGQIYYHNCLHWLDELEEIESKLREKQNIIQGKMKITFPIGMGDAFLTKILLQFQAENPGLILDLILTDTMLDLVAEGIDIAIRVGLVNNQVLQHQKLGVIERKLVTTPDWYKKLPKIETPKDLSEFPFVTFSHLEDGKALTFQGPKGHERLEVKTALISNHVQAMKHAILSGLGLGSLPMWLIHKEIEAGELCIVDIRDFYLPNNSIYIIYPNKHYLPVKVSACLKFFRKNISNIPGIIKET